MHNTWSDKKINLWHCGVCMCENASVNKSVHTSSCGTGTCVCALPVAPLVLCLPLARRWELPIAPCFLSQNITSSQGWSHTDWQWLRVCWCVYVREHGSACMCVCPSDTEQSARLSLFVCVNVSVWGCVCVCECEKERDREHAPNPVRFQPVRVQALRSFHWEPGKAERMDVGNAKTRRGRERKREGVDRGGRWMLYHCWVILRRGGAAAVRREKRNTERGATENMNIDHHQTIRSVSFKKKGTTVT